MKFQSLAILGSCFLMACSSSGAEESAVAAEANSVETEKEQGLMLNEGHKWQVPAPMYWLVQQQKDKLFEYQMAGDTTYLHFGNQLDSLCKELTKQCTMEGEAHNNLHEWLIPHWTIIDQINEAPSLAEAQEQVNLLNNSFNEFEEFFEEE